MTSTLMRRPSNDDDAVRMLFDKATPALQKIVTEWRKREKKSVETSLDTYYWQAKHIKLILDDAERYGKNVVNLINDGKPQDVADVLLRMVGSDKRATPRSKMDYVAVATHIDDEFFARVKAYNEESTRTGYQITEGHLIRLAAIAGDDDRVKKLMSAVEGQTSVNELSMQIREEFGKGELQSTLKSVQNVRPTATVGRIHKRLKVFITGAEEMLTEEFDARIQNVKPRDLDKLLERAAAMLEDASAAKMLISAVEETLVKVKAEATRRKDEAGKNPVKNILKMSPPADADTDGGQPATKTKKTLRSVRRVTKTVEKPAEPAKPAEPTKPADASPATQVTVPRGTVRRVRK